MKEYDFIFAGAGCASLSLVYYLLESPLKDSKILLIDPEINQVPSKTWCYWAESPLKIHPSNAIRFWESLKLSSPKQQHQYSFSKLKYFHLESTDFYDAIWKKIKSNSNIDTLASKVISLEDNHSHGIVHCSGDVTFNGKTIFDSRITDQDYHSPGMLKQLFAGWVVKTEDSLFDSKAMTLMEWSQEISADFEFFYILPFSDKSALIEYTTYSTNLISKKSLERKIQEYLEQKFPDSEFSISFQESGMIPMTTKSREFSSSKTIHPIGTRAGWTKASTGYTFHKIQLETQRIATELVQGKSISTYKSSKRFKFYDNILLNIAHKWPNELSNLFNDLFKKTPMDQLFRFLNEETSIWEELSILSRLRFAIFIKSLISYEKR
ncbi:lycopene cyclase family protein [Algoriphagus hitonicola]|uniref:Lycopene beta-cyclase n=1 Tax=Algoriphagus hitonicola TaxID=435880 RepID=A0A1I2WRY3_9BACT|nr:lycopene cyclase family protein [Algoriphagus hitonicola]SFH04128.1 lycopene beta-cyclase [Algoriphagus hitonicola]